MNAGKPPASIGAAGGKEALLANVALLYYGEGLTQGDIAKRMRVSRATVVNLLREGRDRGIVEIHVEGRSLKGSNLATELREKFALTDVYVAQSRAAGKEASRADTLGHLARVTASAIFDVVEPGDQIGVAWGETVAAVAEAMPRNPVADLDVCQLIGSMISDRVPASEYCAIQIANKLGARCYTLHAPGLISSPALARKLRCEPTIEAQIARLSSLDMTIASIGNVENDTHFVAAGMATRKELKAARDSGAVGIICCRFIDQDGRELDLPPRNRLIAATAENLRAARKRLLAVCGVDRGQAALAALRGGFATHLCADQSLAEFLRDA